MVSPGCFSCFADFIVVNVLFSGHILSGTCLSSGLHRVGVVFSLFYCRFTELISMFFFIF